jgi:hypothetical protein
MGVSIDQGSNVDLSTIAAGGAEFVKRLQDFTDRKNAADAAYERLGIGKDAAAEQDKAARMVSEAKVEADALLKKHFEQIASSKAAVEEWATETKRITLAAREAAEAKEKHADQRHASLDAREAELARREQALDQRVRQIKAAADDDHAKRMAEIAKL